MPTPAVHGKLPEAASTVTMNPRLICAAKGGRMSEETGENEAVKVWFRLMRLETRMRVAVSDRLRHLGLSVPQCDVLTTLTEREGISQQALAERLYVTKGNISGLVDRLVAAGLVERRPIVADKRQHAIYLTASGREAAEKAIACQRRFVAETLGRLPAGKLSSLDQLLIEARDLVRTRG
jgi:MarR family transcriptional regulator, organic hydroperoxide resistance regulator